MLTFSCYLHLHWAGERCFNREVDGRNGHGECERHQEGDCWLLRDDAGVEPSPCFSNFLARTTFVLESLREAKNPGQDAFFWDLRSFLSNFWGFTHFIVDASVLSPHESSAWSTLSLYVNKCLSRSWTNGLFFVLCPGELAIRPFSDFLGKTDQNYCYICMWNVSNPVGPF